MKANEFVREFGWDKAKSVLDKIPLCAHKFDVVDGEVIYLQKVEDSLYWYNKPRKQYDYFSLDCEKYLLDDLKRLVESYELVGKFGCLDMAKDYLSKVKNSFGSECYYSDEFGNHFKTYEHILEQAIQDVESWQ